MAVTKRAIVEYVFSCDCKCGRTETVKVEYNAENNRGKFKPSAPRSWITLQFNDNYKTFYGPWCVISYINSFWKLRIDDATMREMQENHHNKVTNPAVSDFDEIVEVPLGHYGRGTMNRKPDSPRKP